MTHARPWSVGVAVSMSLSVLWATSVASREPQRPSPFRSRIDVVRVDVLVTDDGRPVVGLDARDFEVRDNGVPQPVTLLGLEETPLTVVLTLDLSLSVQGERLTDLRQAARSLVGGLTPGDRAGLVTFNHGVLQRQPLTNSFDRLTAELETVEPGGGTALTDATYAALLMAEADADSRRSLVMVFSDGLDSSSWVTPQQGIDAARRLRSVVYSVAVGPSRARPRYLDDLADATGGQMLHVEKTDNLDELFVQLLREFRQRYVLSYVPTGVASPGWHELEVRVRRRGVEVRARPGYHADGYNW